MYNTKYYLDMNITLIPKLYKIKVKEGWAKQLHSSYGKKVWGSWEKGGRRGD